MSLRILETKWKTTLTAILEELTEPQLGKLMFSLEKIPRGVKNSEAREGIPQLIIQYYGTEGSIAVIDKEMKNIPRMDAAVQDLLRPVVDKLKKQREKNKGATSKRATDSGSAAKKPEAAAGATSKRATDSGSAAKKPQAAAGQQKSCQPAKVQSAAVQTGVIKIVGIKKVNTKNTHLEAEFNSQLQTFFVTSRLLEEACGFKLEGDFKERLVSKMPLSVEVEIKGNKITSIKKI
ncbi:uncharacterized protein LOC122887769 isoform X3 [Siniperca chuatsi]|uniref:uncharacterized protein LOC122887769 isoform X2 n=1 Tax=Siniperca chuatsi TaxID=119488 RepID=UPI001CE134DC|nr:uncharacterized protein LOC122887769 isoform X2 [Siniperca chuatsi]XP_044077208.1 uncharacterized protein LOC122887769 isoform X3 [Siniperca chuatsi]